MTETSSENDIYIKFYLNSSEKNLTVLFGTVEYFEREIANYISIEKLQFSSEDKKLEKSIQR